MTTMNNIQLKFFASIREAVGHGAEAYATHATNLGALRAELAARGAGYADSLAEGKVVRIAVNQTMSDASAALPVGAEVAFFPPVTGG
jgi:sulfur-carrier protein